MLGTLAIAAEEAQSALFAAKGTETRHLVETVHSLVADYQRQAAQGEMTALHAEFEMDAATRLVLSALRGRLQQRLAA